MATKKSKSTKKTSKSAKSSKKAAAKRTTSKKTAAKKASSKRTTSKKTAKTSKAAKKSSKKAASSVTTTNHDEIRNWVESRGGHPATVSGTEQRGEEAGVLRIDYPGYSGAGTLERISWEDFFDKFESERLAFVYQDKRGSRFSKLVQR